MSEKSSYISWDEKTVGSRETAFIEFGKAIDSIQGGIQGRTRAAIQNEYRNIDTNVSVRSGMSRQDYNYFRPGETVASKSKDIMRDCVDNYYSVGFVRNIVDLMSEFATQGIRVYHPNREIERFANNWYKQVEGKERSERFVNTLYKLGNVVVKRATAKIPKKKIEEFKKTVAEADLTIEDDAKVDKKEIPWSYTFLNPVNVDVVNPELAMFTGKRYYSITMSGTLINAVKFPKTNMDRDLVASIPLDIRKAINNDASSLILDSDKVSVYHYKKDDWQVWAFPMTYAILEDLITLKKLKLADLAALDGAISHIRLWKLGSLEHRILPTDSAIAKLSDILLNHVGGGTIDLIWGPDIELVETKADLAGFLGKEKYVPTLESIYAGLGVPQGLTGSGSGSNGTTNNFMSIKTLVERLNYGREILIRWWEQELKILQKAMGWKVAPILLFDHMSLGDETNEKALWIQLVDRNIISIEALQERFGVIPEIEQYRIKREERGRNGGSLPVKVSPYHDANPDLSLEKIALQAGIVTPSEIGMELEQRKAGEKTVVELNDEQAKQSLKMKGQPGQGRPINSKDGQKRKTKVVKPSAKSSVREFTELSLWAAQAQDKISEILNKVFLEKFAKKNMRSLSDIEVSEANSFKTRLLYSLPAYTEIDENSILEILSKPILVYSNCEALQTRLVTDFIAKRGAEPTVDEMRQICSLVFATFKGDYNDSDI